MQALVRDEQASCWYEYTQLQKLLVAWHIDEVVALVAQAELFAETHKGYSVGFVTYEAAGAFDAYLPTQSLLARSDQQLPYALFGLFAKRKKQAHPRQPSFLEATPGEESDARGLAQPAIPWQIDTDKISYQKRLANLDQGIQKGDFYQVNFSARCHADAVSGWQLFLQIGIDARYGAYLQFELAGQLVEIVSGSPELFFARNGPELICCPMKGTISRGATEEDDRRKFNWLVTSEKNRAENLMITDMVRNDLGRIAKPGSVRTKALFAVEAHPSVWQMTSSVSAASDADLAGIFGALFPAASITGAPKRASMAYIAEYEKTPRGIYTGAIGVVGQGGYAQFNVAIRTACVVHRGAAVGVDRYPLSRASYGVGGGIVADSLVSEEYAELLAKTQILSTQPEAFELLETMRLQHGAIYLLEYHLRRLQQSAEFFGFAFNLAVIQENIAFTCTEHQVGTFRTRLLLDRLGGIDIQIFPIFEKTCESQSMVLSRLKVNSVDINLQHKTTRRRLYDSAAAESESHEVILTNEQGYLTESSIANLVFEVGGQYYTPPVSDGLLPGTLRRLLLDEGKILERSLHIGDIDQVESWHLISALRGWRRAHFDLQ